MYIVLAIIAFGILIAVHEAGHFTAAKLLGVKVNEFAIGMGPKLLRKQGKETLYTLRALPFGGFCAMEGENESSEDSRSFTAQKRWRRVVILAAGGIANLIACFIIILILVTQVDSLVGTTLTELADGFPNEGPHGLMAGDTLVSLNGERLYYKEDVTLFLQLMKTGRVDLVIRRDGEKIELNNFPLEPREYMTDGVSQYRYGLTFNSIEVNAMEKLKYSGYMMLNYVRLIRVSIAQLVTGAAGMRDLSGPVGIVDAMNSIGRDSPSFLAALGNIASFMAFIGVNLAIVNLLPIPAMDGGRILFIFITWAIERVIKRRLDPKYEGYIHTTALVLLMGLMVFILVNDVVKIVNG